VVMTTMEVMTTTMVSFLGLSFGDAVPSHVGNSRRYLDTCGVPCSFYSYSFSGDGDSGDDHDDGGNDDDGGDDDGGGSWQWCWWWWKPWSCFTPTVNYCHLRANQVQFCLEQVSDTVLLGTITLTEFSTNRTSICLFLHTTTFTILGDKEAIKKSLPQCKFTF